MLYPIDKNGLVINEASVAKIQEQYKVPIRQVEKICKDSLEGNLQSIYVRGSVSVGRAIIGISDLDIVVIVNTDISESDRTIILSRILEIRETFSFITLIDITILTQETLLNAPEYKNLPIYLKTQSCCLFGESILDTLPSVKPGKDLAIKMYSNLEAEFSDLRNVVAGINQSRQYLYQTQPLKFWCVWTMRTLLRSGLGLVMAEKMLYSQDLKTCFLEFSKKYPDYHKGMEKALEYAMNPIDDQKELLLFFDNFISKYLKLWQPLLVK